MPWGIIEGVYSASYTNAGIIVEDENSSLPWQQVGDHIITTQATFWCGGWKFKLHISCQLNHRK